MRAVEWTLFTFLVAITGGLWLSLVRVFGEEEAPLLRLGSRLSAPRPVAMGRLLDRLGRLRKRFTQQRRTLFMVFFVRLD